MFKLLLFFYADISLTCFPTCV